MTKGKYIVGKSEVKWDEKVPLTQKKKNKAVLI